jgi:hypothetical protein
MGKARDLARISPDSSGRIALPSGVSGVLPDANAPSGSIIQVVSSSLTSRFSTSSTSFTNIGLSANITPSNSSNKILLMFNGNACETYVNPSLGFRFVRTVGGSGVAVGIGDSSFSGQVQASINWNRHNMEESNPPDSHALSMNFLDSPATTSAITYNVQIMLYAGTAYVNGNNRNNNGTYDKSQISTLTLMEIAA